MEEAPKDVEGRQIIEEIEEEKSDIIFEEADEIKGDEIINFYEEPQTEVSE
jgi:hypothetical protein